MKKLSIEEKSQRYDEALKKAKDFYKGYKQRNNQLYADDLESIFPELKEDGDEKIRKWLIMDIKQSLNDNVYNDESIDSAKEALAWLEKQGEQKSAWSEEDEKMLDFAIMAVGLCKQYAINHQVNGYSKLPDVPKRYEELQDWLKSIKERIGCEVNCTTTNKWSEEDEKILKTITSDVLRMRQKCGIGTDEWNIRSNALNWLKYHLSQRRWKPTEKQLMELKCAIRGCSFNIEQLVSLEEQLEQL